MRKEITTQYIKGDFLDPIIVLGPGKCGTSVVAILLRAMGVFMGSEFRHTQQAHKAPTERYPFGSYEDWDFVMLSYTRFFSHEERRGAMRNLVTQRRSLGIRWGFKEPKFINYAELYFEVFKKPLLIHCTRPRRECGSRTTTWHRMRRKYYNLFGNRSDVLTVEFNNLIYGDTKGEIERIAKFVSIDVPAEDLLPYVARRGND